MSARLVFAGVGLLALLAGAALWFGGRASTGPSLATGTIEASPAAIYTALFQEGDGTPRSLGQFQGKVVVVNFWATWCGPCKEEMPGFVRLQSRWAGRNVQFVGLADDVPSKVAAFGREVKVNYPLWMGDTVMPLSRRLGNRLGVLPHTVILDAQGRVVESRIGLYAEKDLEARLQAVTTTAQTTK